ncbi:MAG: response regulator transcription factor [Solirubrobacteraceae bacterium]|jgi:two-component system nitrate/nitrite response regulator NarL
MADRLSALVADRPRVIVVDDHQLFRSSLVSLLRERGVMVVAEVGMAAEAVALAAELAPDVVLMDLNMPGMSGAEATQRVAAVAPLVSVVILTVIADERHVMEALLAGARGYMLKDSPIDQIVDGIQAAARGESMITPRIAGRLVQRLRAPSGLDAPLSGAELTPREREVLGLLAAGFDNPEIARSMQISPHTVKNHVSSILIKLQVENRIQAAVRAVRGGLL